MNIEQASRLGQSRGERGFFEKAKKKDADSEESVNDRYKITS